MDIVFRTSRLNFKKFNLDNFDDFCKINQNKELMKYFFGYEKTYRECLEKYKEMMETEEKFHYNYWAVYNQKNEFIGQCGFLNNYDGTVNLCYAYYKKFWGKGFATEAAKGAIGYMFNTFSNINSLTAMSYFDNEKSIKVLTKLKFLVFKESENKQGKVFHYKLTREEFENNREHYNS